MKMKKDHYTRQLKIKMMTQNLSKLNMKKQTPYGTKKTWRNRSLKQSLNSNTENPWNLIPSVEEPKTTKISTAIKTKTSKQKLKIY